MYVPSIPVTTGAVAAGPERRKNIHARAKTMASATRVAAKLGGRLFTRAAPTRRLILCGGVAISPSRPWPCGRRAAH